MQPALATLYDVCSWGKLAFGRQRMRTASLIGEHTNVPTHGGGYDERASLALLEVVTNSAGAVENTSQISVDDLLPVVHRGVENASIRRAAGIRDENLDLAEVGDDLLDQIFNAGVVGDVALVRLRLDAVLVLELLGVLLAAGGAGRVGDGNVGAKLGAAPGGLGANAGWSGGSGDDDNLSLQASTALACVAAAGAQT
jgi:hypothetical protein